MLPNVPAMIELHFGPAMIGAVLNTLNTRLDAEAIAFMLDHGEAKFLFTDREFSAVIAKALTLVRVGGAGHFLLRRISLWTDLVVGYSLRLLGVQAPVGREATSIFEQVPSTLTV